MKLFLMIFLRLRVLSFSLTFRRIASSKVIFERGRREFIYIFILSVQLVYFSTILTVQLSLLHLATKKIRRRLNSC